jgi:epoxide hydrolase 4
MDIEHTYLTVNNLHLHTVQAGPQDGPLVILLHGFPEFWRGWIKQIGPLAEAGYRVVVPDQRGYNLSDKPEGVASYNIEQSTADVDDLIAVLGREKVFLVGHDWGAAVAWETALRYPQRLEKLAILNVPHLDVMNRFLFSSFAQMRKSWYIFFFQIPYLPEWLLGRNDCTYAVRMLLGSSNKGSFSRADIEEYKLAWKQPGALTAMINWYRAMLRQRLKGPWNPQKIVPRRVHVPTLMLWGKNDIALSWEMAQPSIDLCDAGQLIFFENATHWVQHDEAEAVNRQLLAFLGNKQ